ncbi:MAG: RluA family pseudouridine synthase [Clostridia bacterium]|nr:RluA family pseudouridine synthase [Clostridia bacterium]
MITKLESVVPEGIENMSAAAYLDRAFPLLGKGRISRLLSERQLRVNGEKTGAGSSVNGGDTLALYVDGGYDRSLKLLYDLGGLVAFIKPRGLPSDADENGIGEDTALSRLKLIHPGARLAHRLDAGTYGVMLAATDAETLALLEDLFRQHLLIKRYSATVVGRMPKPHDALKAYLVKDAASSRVRVSDRRVQNALEIETDYFVRRSYAKNGIELSRLSIVIPTGRTHQIRAHLGHVGHPLLGDDKYGDRSVNRLLGVSAVDLRCDEISIKSVPEAGIFAGMRFALEK